MSESPSSFQPVVDDPLFGVVNRGQVQYSSLGLPRQCCRVSICSSCSTLYPTTMRVHPSLGEPYVAIVEWVMDLSCVWIWFRVFIFSIGC